MATRDTSWIWDTTSGALIEANANEVDFKQSQERVYVFPFGTYERTRTVRTLEWIVVSKAAAKAAVTLATSDTATNENAEHSAVEVNRITGDWKFMRAVDSRSAWS